uniref:Uncharacterized protein n=1 Tax=Mus spicilegus TaxID=10103 RepID=A0A8C6GCK4_MUSSI
MNNISACGMTQLFLGHATLLHIHPLTSEQEPRKHQHTHTTQVQLVETFQKLQKAKEILCNAESRARYDHWRRSQMSMPFEQWEALADSVKTVSFSLGMLGIWRPGCSRVRLMT